MSRRLLVLGWHNIAGTYGFPAPEGAAERGFARQMQTLSRVANVIDLEQGLARLTAGEKLPSRAVAITFDDGYADNLTLGAPILERHKLPATFFLVPRFLSGELDAWWETLGWAIESSTCASFAWEGAHFTIRTPPARQATYSAIAKQLKLRDSSARSAAMDELLDTLAPQGERPDLFMDWAGARELLNRGFSVQAHTSTHPVLSRESHARQTRELVDARRELQTKLGIGVSTLAYPHGGPDHYGADTVAIAEEAGYTWAVTTREGFATRDTKALEVNRCLVYPERGNVDLLAQLRYMLQAWLQEARST
ncbi:MAG: polysaccharide deacetylase family protein [Arthrospira platensis]